jgi:serine/threonine protein kinase
MNSPRESSRATTPTQQVLGGARFLRHDQPEQQQQQQPPQQQSYTSHQHSMTLDETGFDVAKFALPPLPTVPPGRAAGKLTQSPAMAVSLNLFLPDVRDGATPLSTSSSTYGVLGRGAHGVVVAVDPATSTTSTSATANSIANDGPPLGPHDDGATAAAAPLARKLIPLSGDENSAASTELVVARRMHALAVRRPEAARHLLRVHAVRVGQTEAAIDMELLDAGDLARFAPLPSDAHVAAVALQLLRGLRALHCDVRALHRDIKLQNALASRDGRVRLVDFGSAAVGDPAAEGDITSADQQGSVLQMAPERLRGERHGQASDVWALGVMLAELATGAHPFVPADAARGLGSTERFWALAEVIRHTASPDECAAATDAAVTRALASRSPEVQSFIGAMLRAEPSARATVPELLEHPFVAASRASDTDVTTRLAPLFSAAPPNHAVPEPVEE